HSRSGFKTSVEIAAFLVPDRRGRPDDQSQDTTFHGRKNESYKKVSRGRSHSTAHCATESCGHHPGSKAGCVLRGMSDGIGGGYLCTWLRGGVDVRGGFEQKRLSTSTRQAAPERCGRIDALLEMQGSVANRLFGNDGRAMAGRYRKGATAMRNFV